MKRVIFLSLFLAVGVGCFAQASRDDLEKKKDDLVKEIQSLQHDLNQTRKSKKNNVAQLATLQKKIRARQSLIGTYNSQIGQLNQAINNKVTTVRALRGDLTELKKNYANMVYYAYKHRDAYDRLLFLFSARDFNDAFMRLKYIRRYNAYRRQQANLIHTTVNDLNTQMTNLRTQRKDKQKKLNEQEEQKKKLDTEKGEKNKLMKSLTVQEKQLKSSINKKKKEQEALKKQIADLIRKEIEEAKKAAAAAAKGSATKSTGVSSLALTPEAAALSAGFASNQGKLPWPVERGEITDAFGTHAHPVFDNLTVKNNGIDIKTTKNASARAIFKGTVVGIITNPGYHKAVLVRHGEFFTVYSNLESVKVKANEEVNTKQSLGTVYTDPATGETIMHLEIWKGTTLLNPASWIAGK